MTGWRIGFAAGPKSVISLARNLQSHSTSNANSIAQYATLAALNNYIPEISIMVAEFQKRRDLIISGLRDINGIKPTDIQGAFYAFFDVSSFYNSDKFSKPITNSTDFCSILLEELLIGLIPGSAFGNDNCVRMSFACSSSDIQEGINRLKKLLN